MRCQETGKRPFAWNNTAAAAAGGCLRQRGGAKTARVAGGRVARCGGESARGRGEGARRWASTEAEGAGLQDFGKGNEMRSTGSGVAPLLASTRT